jgi:small subunit ribosomal protein S16
MLVIRYLRRGKKNQPFFKIVVNDKRRAPRGGRFVEQVGFWNPLTKEKKLEAERIKYWMSVGAKPSPSVFNLLVSAKIVEGKKVAVHKKSKKKEVVNSATTPAQGKAVPVTTENKSEAPAK